MFYLNEFFKVLKSNLIVGQVFFVSTLCLISLSHHHKEIESGLSLNKKVKTFPYFNALVANTEKVDSVVRRMKQLPGVVSVDLGNEKAINTEIVKLKSTFGADIVKGLTSLNYKKIKIELELGLKEKSHNLIREYLTRLVGKESVTIGSLKSPKKIKLEKHDPLFDFLKWVDTYAFIVLCSLWLMSVVLLLKPINSNSFIIEKFQRKNKTNVKIFMSGLLAFILPAIGINYYFHSQFVLESLVVIFSLVLIAGTLTFFSKKVLKFNYAKL